jgi:hypothetical protein
MNDKSVVRQIIELENKSVEELREIYDKIMPSPIKTHVSKDYLKPRIAYRLQELALGELKDEIKSKLLKIANNHDHPNRIETKKLLPGTKICKKWGDIIHEVEVLRDGFVYAGQNFKSLSAIAKVITGTKWNGFKFFKVS